MALALGMTVSDLSHRMGANEFDQWREYYSVEPFGQERDNWHMATLASLYMSAHSKNKTTADDFMYRSKKENDAHTTRATMSAMSALAKPK